MNLEILVKTTKKIKKKFETERPEKKCANFINK